MQFKHLLNVHLSEWYLLLRNLLVLLTTLYSACLCDVLVEGLTRLVS